MPETYSLISYIKYLHSHGKIDIDRLIQALDKLKHVKTQGHA